MNPVEVSTKKPTAESPPASPARHAPSVRLVEVALRYGMLIVLVALVVCAQVLYPGFLQLQNIENILLQNAPLGIIAVGMTYVLITGGIDLSVGALYGAGATVYASLAVLGWPLLPAALVTLAVGLVAGAINGIVVAGLRVNPFVATLGTASVFAGATSLYSHSKPFAVSDPAFTTLGRGQALGLPYSIWLLVAVVVVASAVLVATVYGRSLYAIGGNAEAARLVGMRVRLMTCSSYVLLGACSTMAGMLIASRVGVGQADIGASMSLDAIAVVVIGGTSLLGGEGAVWRSVVGLLILAILTNLLDSLAVDSNVQLVIKGTIVIAAVAMDSYSRMRRSTV
ncbi:ABC transporter permease [Amycolatopsis sp. lyj-90]|uniref:ABC transporter permease n=1 Tax=Amycolatopsis sp. lyj-90 TaxID=2789285 RepID=UPI00397E3E09